MNPVALLLFTLTLLPAAEAAPPGDAKAQFDPLDCRWTFGNHEPISMYRRIGRLSTGGIEGSARWLEEWHHWFDSEACTQTMQDLGLNILHCRFYKGMGWQFESKDFPNVKRFVANCHKHGIRALAYVQFATLYYETMLNEVPDLADWVAIDENGRKRTYFGNGYFRWLPCINAPGFEPYLVKMIQIALTEGDFDGIMFDNCIAPPCYCPRCTALFRQYLAQQPDCEKRFGMPSVDHVLPPPAPPAGFKADEIQDPITQQWIQFRCQRMTELFRRLYQAGKACKPSALMTGNVANIRQARIANTKSLVITDLSDCFDIFVSQSGNEPGLQDGCIINRVREMKLAVALHTPILALSDADAGISASAEAKFTLDLVENAVFGGIPIDRLIMKADPQMVSPQLIAARKPVLQRFNAAVRAGRQGLKRPSYAPVQLLYSRESLMLSEQSHQALLLAEEILLRNHVPFGLLPTAAASPLAIPKDCQVLLVCDQRCLSDGQLQALQQYADQGGRLVLTGQSGLHDECYCQRKTNPLDALAGLPNVVRRQEAGIAPIKGTGWTTKVAAPVNGGQRLVNDIDSLWPLPFKITAPPTVFAEIKRDAARVTVHLLNYASEPVAKGARIELRAGQGKFTECSFAAPMEGKSPEPLAVQRGEKGGFFVDTPAFADYAVVEFSLSAQ